MRNFRLLALGAAVATLMASCSGTTPERAFSDARAQMGHKKAGFEANRDPGKLLEYAANLARGEDEIRRYNRTLGNFQVEHGRIAEGYRAFEKAALAGDEAAALRVAKAHYTGQYRPSDISKIASASYLPAAKNSQNVSIRLLLARLVASGEVNGTEFKTSAYWLESAAALGSSEALILLAEQSEAAGNIASAAAYYARVDRGSAKDRAMRQARDFYLGQGRRSNIHLGRAWLQRLTSIDPSLAAQLAARIYRKTDGKIDAEYLEATARSGGITNLRSGPSLARTKIMEQYSAAKTDDERAKILQPLRDAASGGDAAAALTLAKILLETNGDRSEILALTEKAMAKGNKDALPLLTRLATLTDRNDSNAPAILAAIESAASKGDVAAAKQLSMIYSIGGLVDADQEKSRSWLRRAADAGDNEAQYQIGVALWTNAKTEEEKKQARAYIEKSASAGNVAAQTYLETAIVPAGSN